MQQQLEGLLSTSAEVAATINAAVAREEQLQEKVGGAVQTAGASAPSWCISTAKLLPAGIHSSIVWPLLACWSRVSTARRFLTVCCALRGHVPDALTQVDLLHLHQRQEVLPKLQALLEEGQAARAFARDELMTDLKHLWEMPAMHLVPHHKCRCQGKGVLGLCIPDNSYTTASNGDSPQTSASRCWLQRLHRRTLYLSAC